MRDGLNPKNLVDEMGVRAMEREEPKQRGDNLYDQQNLSYDRLAANGNTLV
jgi:hypothetical protein